MINMTFEIVPSKISAFSVKLIIISMYYKSAQNEYYCLKRDCRLLIDEETMRCTILI